MDALDILRGLLALAVACYHFTVWYPVFRPAGFLATAAAKAGNYGVEGFFIISGFCFFFIYGQDSFRGRGLRDFHLRRFLRIAPLYYLVVLLGLALGVASGPPPTPRFLLENATLTFGLFHPNHSLVLGGWSIGIEYVFYLLFPLLAWASGKFKPFLPLAALALVLLSIPWTLHYVPEAPFDQDRKFHAYVQLANHGFLFLLGGLLARARARCDRRLTGPAFLALVAVLGWLFCHHVRGFYDHFEALVGTQRYVLLALCLALVAAFAFAELPRSPLRRAGIYLGEISYSVYLLHPFAQAALRRFAPDNLAPGSAMATGLVLTLAMASLTYRLVERPAMGLARRWTA